MPVLFSGTQANRDAFARMLSECTGTTVTIGRDGRISRTPGGNANARPLLDVLDNLIGAAESLIITVTRSPRDETVVCDSYGTRTIDLDDLDQFDVTPPAGSPHATTRCEVIIHILAEYKFALHRGQLTGAAGFDDAHNEGVAAQTRWRTAQGQAGPAHGNVLTGLTLTFHYCNGATTVVTFDETGRITDITHNPPPSESRCLIATAAYGSEVDEVLAPFRAFRDEVARETRRGREFFDRYEDVYYRFSPRIADAMRADNEVKEVVRDVFVVPWTSYLRLAFARPADWSLTEDNEELRAFLELARRDLDAWIDRLVELPDGFEGLSATEAVAELNIALGLVARDRGRAYLDRLVGAGALPLAGPEGELAAAAAALRASGRSEEEIETILGKEGEAWTSSSAARS